MPGCSCRDAGLIPLISPAIAKENRRHKRLMAKATKLDLEDLLEIAAAKQWTAPELDAAAARGSPAPPPAGVGSSGSVVGVAEPTASAAEVHPGRDAPSEDEKEEERAD